jgi:AcrR family transcriptional regulator
MKSTEVGKQIKEKANKLFFSYGLKSVSMDDLAKVSGISKRTIYQFYENKNALIESVVDELILLHDCILMASQRKATNAIDEVIKLDRELIGKWIVIRPCFFIELETYFPEVWEKLEHYKITVLEGIIHNLERGKIEGYYREDIDADFIADLRMQQIVNLLQPQFLIRNPKNIHHLAEELTMLYLHSITTEKGKNLLYKYVGRKEK